MTIRRRPRCWPFAAAPLLVLAVSCAPRQEAVDPARIAASAFEVHMRVLADDRMEGRGTGTRGYQMAADYVAAQFDSVGLEPAGSNGTFLQPVPLREGRLVAKGSSVWLIRGGATRALVHERDFTMRPDLSHTEAEITAPLVFAGYGITAPELDRDDYAGLDVRGKIVVLLAGAPPSFPTDQRAWYSHSRVKSENAVAHGAAGILNVRTPIEEARSPWEKGVLGSRFSSMAWLTAEGVPHREYPELRGVASLSRGGARMLFEGASRSLEAVFQDIESGTVHGFPLPGEARIRRVSTHAAIESPNVVGVLRGSDPALRDEYLVYSAHLDHLGIGSAVNGDSVYNGAFDNASGCAALIEIARAMAAGKPPRRSVLFVAVTAEEKGLQGAEYFAENPTVPKGSMVANLNMDMFMMFHPAHDLIATGMEHSTLDGPAIRAAEQLGIALAPDPIPEEVVFVRSDQLCFMRTGIPALFVRSGQTSGDSAVDGRALARQWRLERYHMPSDDLAQPIDFEAGAQTARLNYLIGWEVANADARPMWKAGDFFGGKFGGPMETK